MSLLVIAITAAAMIYLVRRLMRGMNQQDWILLRHARARGIDPAQPQNVDFVLFLASVEAANLVSDELRKDGFETSMKLAQLQYARNRANPGEPQEGYLVTAKRRLLLYPAELAKLRSVTTVLALGTVAHDAVLMATGLKRSAAKFGHGSEHELPENRRMIDSYHCSRYNTQTRRLTTEMFQTVLRRAATQAGLLSAA